MSLPYKKEHISLAKQLRSNATPQENHLWYDFLSKYPVRFQRQKAIGNYIADFYCSKAKLVVEIDGGQHYTKEGKEKDAQRSEFFQGQGIAILRFTNPDVDQKFRAVCATIDSYIKQKTEAFKTVVSVDDKTRI